MESNIVVAIVSASSATIIGITALLINSGRFTDIGSRFTDMNKRVDSLESSLNKRMDSLESSLNSRMDSLESSLNSRMDRIERTLEVISSDLKEFYRDITRLKQKAGLD